MDVVPSIEVIPRKPRSVCRNLFGSPSDASENTRLLQQQIKQVMETCSQRWNFDFGKFRPLDGRYEWRRPAEDFSDRRTTSGVDCSVQTESVAVTTITTSLPVATSSTYFRRKRQATITDYFPCRKHMRTHSVHSTDAGAK